MNSSCCSNLILPISPRFACFCVDVIVRISYSQDLKIEMLALLEQFDQIFQHCLDPQEDATFDHQMGIRKYPNSILPLDFWSNIRCVGRMTRLYALPKKKTSLFGHKATSILFHRPLGQVRSYIFPQIYSILWLFFTLLYYYCFFYFSCPF